MTTKSETKPAARPLPADLADVALISAATCAGLGEASISWWHSQVRAGRAPKPVIQQTRFTRWLLADAIRFWAERAKQAQADSEAGERLVVRAKKASMKAREPVAVAKALATKQRNCAARSPAKAA